MLAGAGYPDVGMEIIDESEEEKMVQAVVKKQGKMIEAQKEKRKASDQKAPALSSVKRPQDLLEQPQPVTKTSPEMEQRIQQVMDYKEKLKQRAQNR